jgi:aconitate hydratase
MLIPPLPDEQARQVALIKGPNIAPLPELDPLPDSMTLPVLLKVGDDVSTDEIMPAGARVLPFRSNIPRISEFCFEIVDDTYPRRAEEVRDTGGHVVVGGDNYGQGSSREHAALAPRYLGLRLVLAKSFARIHWQNLVNYGVLPLNFAHPADYDRIAQGDLIHLEALHSALRGGAEIQARVGSDEWRITLMHELSPRQIDVLLAGGLINFVRGKRS